MACRSRCSSRCIEPDFLDTTKDGAAAPGAARIIQGVEFDGIGRRAAYWLFREHPGSTFARAGGCGIAVACHPARRSCTSSGRRGRGRCAGCSWFAPVMLAPEGLRRVRRRDADEAEDRRVPRRRSRPTSTGQRRRSADDDRATRRRPTCLEPGVILNVAPGRAVTRGRSAVGRASTPTIPQTVLRAIAAGSGVTYEDLTGRLHGHALLRGPHVAPAALGARRRLALAMLIPQFCDPVWRGRCRRPACRTWRRCPRRTGRPRRCRWSTRPSKGSPPSATCAPGSPRSRRKSGSAATSRGSTCGRWPTTIASSTAWA